MTCQQSQGIDPWRYHELVDTQRAAGAGPNDEAPGSGWTFLSNHAHVLVCIARDPEIRLADIARMVGIGERAAHRIVSDLVETGYVVRHRRGRNNHYEVNLDLPLRHPLESASLVAEIVGPLTKHATTA